MPTKRKPVSRRMIAGVSETMLWKLSDGLYPEPREVNEWELLAEPGLDYPGGRRFDRCRELWDSCKAGILKDWIKAHPGTRPSFWWLYDAPRMTEAEVEERGWTGCYFVPEMAEPRRRLGGIGHPKHEHLAYVPSFHCGVPDDWLSKSEVDYYSGHTYDTQGRKIEDNHVTDCRKEKPFTGKAINPKYPPIFESQATYLDRHGLLLPEEKRRLRPKDFEPEAIQVDDEEAEESNIVPWPKETPGSIQ